MTTHTCGGVGGNQAPNPPTIVNSKTTCEMDAEGSDSCGFRVSADDPDGDDIRYYFDWGDGETTHTVWVDSGEARWKRHTYTSFGTYTVKIWTRDNNSLDSSEVTRDVEVVEEITHKECVEDTCEDVPGVGSDECVKDSDCEIEVAGESEMETENIHFSFEFVYIILILVVGFLFAWKFLIRKNLTYLYELFKMNAGKVTLILMIAFVLVFSIHFSSVYAADLFKEWKCGSGLTCGSSCQGVSYKPIGGTNDPEFTFSAEAGIYNCEVSVKNNWFAFTGDTPELTEYSDVYLNDVRIGNTDDLFCNSVTPNGNGNGPGGGPCRGGELNVIDKEIYTRTPIHNLDDVCGGHYGYCSRSPGIPVGCCAEESFTVQSHYLEDGKWARIRVSGGARCHHCKVNGVPTSSCCKNKAGKIFLSEEPCSAPNNGLCQMPPSTICSVQDHRGASTCCDLSGYVGQTIYACACNTERAYGCDNPDEGQHPVAIAVCGYGTNMETCSGGGDGNQAPDPPTIVNSKTTCPVDAEGSDRCGFRVSADDPDGDQVRYHFDWGDGETGHTIWVDSGEQRWKRHIYTSAGTYTVKIKTEDANGAFSSEISDSVTVAECIEDEDCEFFPFEICINHVCVESPCFLPGTEIRLADGSVKNIEDIEIGDGVLSFGEDGVVVSTVAEFYSSESNYYYILGIENHEVGVTRQHEFYIGNGKFRAVKDLTFGDEIYVLGNRGVVPERIVHKELIEEPVKVYNMRVGGTPTYFANGFAVHNKIGNGPEMAGESDMETEGIQFSFEFVYIILILVVGFLFAWKLIIRKNLTYLYELFKMNAGKVMLILVIAFVLSFSIHFSSVYAADLFKEWKCGSGLTCGSD
ncbi:MAG: PKD domain-containing protein, partial [Candidatus Aenigmatarchaeota archaeon]